MQIVIFSS